MSALLVGFVAGAASMWLFGRFVLRVVRKKFSSPESTIRKNLLDSMGYDALLSFQRAVEAEIAKRRGA